jgi:hypothetical protein
MPSRAGQEELLLRLHRDIGVEPNKTSFVEVRQCLFIFEAIRRLYHREFQNARAANLRNRATELEHRLGKRSLTSRPVINYSTLKTARDPIDASAISSVVASRTSPVHIGSVKSNLGSVLS